MRSQSSADNSLFVLPVAAATPGTAIIQYRFCTRLHSAMKREHPAGG
jgi:hypothetical protein